MKTIQRQQSLYFLIIILSLAVSLLIASSFLKDLFYRQVTVDLEQTSRILANLLPRDSLDNQAVIESFCGNAGRDSGVRVTVILADGTVAGDSQQKAALMENHSDRPEIINAMAMGTGVSRRYSATQDRMLMYFARRTTAPDGSFPVVVRIAVALDLLKGKLAGMNFRILLVAVFALLVSLLLSLFLVRSINKPIMRLIRSARVFGESGKWPVTIIEKPRELKLLARTISKITDQLNRRLEEIRWQSRQINAIFDSMIEPLVVLDSDLVILDMNPAAADMLKGSGDKLTGKNLLDVFRNSELQDFAHNTVKSNAAQEMEVRLPADIVSSREERIMQVHGTVISDLEGQKNRILLVFNDISRIKQLERIRKDFVANVSHELKTPITSIKGFIETLLDGGLDDVENARHFLRITSRQTEHLIAILNDLLVLSELEKDNSARPEKAEVNIKLIIDNAVTVCTEKAEQKNICIINRVSDRLMPVNAVMIEQALINLIDNAVKYSEEGSSVTISLSESRSGIKLEIADQGIGIPEEARARVFERFYRVDKGRSRDKGGTGLGLAIVRHIMKSHGGDVEVTSAEGKGSSFFLIFPN